MLRQYSILDCVECGCLRLHLPGEAAHRGGDPGGKTAGKGGTIMRFAMSSSPHIRCGDNTRRIMLDVLIALLPTLLAGTIFFGLRCPAACGGIHCGRRIGRGALEQAYPPVPDRGRSLGRRHGAAAGADAPGHRALLDGGGGRGVCRHCSEGCLRWPGPEHFQSRAGGPRPAAVAVSRVHDPLSRPLGHPFPWTWAPQTWSQPPRPSTAW